MDLEDKRPNETRDGRCECGVWGVYFESNCFGCIIHDLIIIPDLFISCELLACNLLDGRHLGIFRLLRLCIRGIHHLHCTELYSGWSTHIHKIHTDTHAFICPKYDNNWKCTSVTRLTWLAYHLTVAIVGQLTGPTAESGAGGWKGLAFSFLLQQFHSFRSFGEQQYLRLYRHKPLAIALNAIRCVHVHTQHTQHTHHTKVSVILELTMERRTDRGEW